MPSARIRTAVHIGQCALLMHCSTVSQAACMAMPDHQCVQPAGLHATCYSLSPQVKTALQIVCPVHLDSVTHDSMHTAPDPLKRPACGAMIHEVNGQVAAGSTVVSAEPHHRQIRSAVATNWHTLKMELSLDEVSATCVPSW